MMHEHIIMHEPHFTFFVTISIKTSLLREQLKVAIRLFGIAS